MNDSSCRGKTVKSLRPTHTASMDSSLQLQFAASICNDAVNAGAAAVDLQNSHLFYPNLLSQPLLRGHLTNLGTSPISAYSSSVCSQSSPNLWTPDSLYRAETHGLVPDNIYASVNDFNDPTDAHNACLRPLPAGRSRSLLQILDLPPLIQRHEMRLYLGPANFAKVCRMSKMVDGSSNESWLLLQAELFDSVQIIESLVQKPFSLTPGLNIPSQTINPRFVLYEMNSQNQLALLPSEEIPQKVRSDRLINVHMHSQIVQSKFNLAKIQSTLAPNRFLTMDNFHQNVPPSGLSLDPLQQFGG